MARRGRIVLVDDDASARGALERALVEANYGVVSALNGREALRQVPFDIAVLGLGHEACSDWDALDEYQPRLRLIVAGAGSEGFAHPLASSAEALLEKPIDLSLLFETLKAIPASSSPSETCLEHE